MEFIRIVLMISLLHCSDAVSLEDVVASLQAAEDMLKAMDDNQGAVDESAINDLKTELKEHVDEQIKSHVKTKICHERMYLQGFIAEKKMRKQLEAKTVALQTELDVLKEAVSQIRGQLSDLKNNDEQISTRVDDVSRHVGSAVDSCTANVQKVKEALERSRTNAAVALQTELDVLKGAVTQNRVQFSDLKNNAEQISTRVDDVSRHVGSAVDSCTAHVQKVKEAFERSRTNAAVALQTELDVLKGAVTQNRVQFSDLKNNAEQISTRVDDVSRHVGSAVDSCTANVQKVKEDFVRSQTNANSRLEDKVTHLEKTLTTSLDASRNELFGLTEKNSIRIDVLAKSVFELTPMRDCLDIRDAGITSTGVYTITLETTNETVNVLCDMDTHGGGWTVFRNRFNGSVDFYRNFSEYKDGFGVPNGEYWLGLRYIYELTRRPTELDIELLAADGSSAYETFQHFSLAADPAYTLDISGQSGTARLIRYSSSGILYNNGYKFSTFDRDQDANSDNCAVKRHGGWWYHDCTYVNLNGYYAVPGTSSGYGGRDKAGMVYYSFKGFESLKSSRMMLRRRGN